jgi:hypothetical protein
MSVVRPPKPTQSLEATLSNLSIRDDPPVQPPKQSRNRGRNRGTSSMSKQSSPQRTFHGRTSSEDQHASTTRASTGSVHHELGMSVVSGDISRKGLLQISTQSQQLSNRNQESMPVIRLPATEISRPAAFNDNHDSMNTIPSEDTNFGSDISRGAVQEGRLYNHKQVEKSPTLKPRDRKSAGVRQVHDKPQAQPQRGLLRIQPTKPEEAEKSKQESGHRGGLLFIDTSAIKPAQTKATKAPGQNSQLSEFKRNVVVLRKEAEGQPRTAGNPDSVPTSWAADSMLRDGPKYVLTPEDILHEVKLAYQEIQNLERKVETTYESRDDGMEMSHTQDRPHADGGSWSTYSSMHKEYLPTL